MSKMRKIEEASRALKFALEGVRSIKESAELAFLETEPCSRLLPKEYEKRYQQFARAELETALRKYEQVQHTSIHSQLHIDAADCMLARDKIDAGQVSK